MPFDNVRFPTAIARGASGGPERRTDVVATVSGREERNSRWAHSRRKYNVGFGARTIADVQAIIAFFEERRGKLYAFRFKDHADFKSSNGTAAIAASDQVLGTGNGTNAAFQLVKKYGGVLRPYSREIFAPVAGTVVVAVNGTPTVNFTVNLATGIVTFNAGSVPANGATVTAGFEFDVPVRFDTDEITVNLEQFQAGAIPDIPLIEVRP